MRFFFVLLFGLGSISFAQAQDISCGNTEARAWWDVQHYDLDVDLDSLAYLKGKVQILSKVIGQPADSMQIDLKAPLKIDSALFRDHTLSLSKTGDHYFLHFPFTGLKIKDTFSVLIYYSGVPEISNTPPWSSGMVYAKDSSGAAWWAVACESKGAAVWFPCKNLRSDEADSVTCHYTAPSQYEVIGNGRLRSKKTIDNGQKTIWNWAVVNPVNNYDITFYLGQYVHWQDTFQGINGTLDLDFYVLPQDLEKARKQFQEVKPMLSCFEEKLGPYPFYQDGYKLVEAPYLGMEHQSAVAYGNEFKMGYLGKDRSGTGVGLKFDFIIVHESGHEWFGNSITAADMAYTWIQEGFTTYTETIFAECLLGKAAAFKYQQGKRAIIKNDKPVEGRPGSCDEGSSDHYDKAAFMIHMIRMIMQDDAKFYALLRAMNKQFFHQVVSGRMIENFINQYSGISFDKVFNQYLRKKDLPVLVFKSEKNHDLKYRWEDCVEDFDMPVAWYDGHEKKWLKPTTKWQTLKDGRLQSKQQISRNFLINIRWENDRK